MTFSSVVTCGAAAVLAAVAAAAASPAAAVGVGAAPALHPTFRQASAIPPELLAGKQPPGFFEPGTEPSPAPQLGPTPTAAPTTKPVTPGGGLTPTKEHVGVLLSHGMATARTRDAECTLLAYEHYRPSLITKTNVVYTDAAGKRMAVVGLGRRIRCVIPQGDLTKGAPMGVVHAGKVYASIGASGQGGWCEAGAALLKDAVSASHKTWSRAVQGGVRVTVYTEGEAMCELVAGSRKLQQGDEDEE